MRDKEESAQALFERINRRRGTLEVEIDSALGSGPVSPTVPTRSESAPVASPVPPSASASSSAPSVPWSAADVTSGTQRRMDEQPLRIDELLYPSSRTHRDVDTFPRSATMRFILKNPVLALGVGIPAAAVVLRSSSTRRMLKLALDVGTRPSVREAIGLSTATVRLMQTRERPRASAATPRPGATQKKTP